MSNGPTRARRARIHRSLSRLLRPFLSGNISRPCPPYEPAKDTPTEYELRELQMPAAGQSTEVPVEHEQQPMPSVVVETMHLAVSV